jgi:hypothetical protein
VRNNWRSFRPASLPAARGRLLTLVGTLTKLRPLRNLHNIEACIDRRHCAEASGSTTHQAPPESVGSN